MKTMITQPIPSPLTFPCLMQHKDHDCVVLMTGREGQYFTGVALNRPNYKNVRSGCEWWDPSDYIDFVGTITLEND